MIYYKDSENKVYAYKSEDFAKDGLIKIEESEAINLASNSNFNAASDDQGGEAVTGVPNQVTRAQGKAALIQAGIWPSVIEFMDSIEDPTERALADVALNDTTHWQRSSLFLNQVAEALGVSQSQLDALFTTASTIVL